MQTLLIAAVIFLGFQLFFGNKGPTETERSNNIVKALASDDVDGFTKLFDDAMAAGAPLTDLEQDLSRAFQKMSSDQILKVLGILDSKLDKPGWRKIALDRSTEFHSNLNSKIASEVEVKSLTAEAEKERRVAGMVLIGDIQLKAGVLINDTGPLTQAYYMLHGQDQNFGEALWKQKTFAVGPTEKFPESSVSGSELYEKLVQELRVQFHDHLILGALPGFQIIDALVRLTGSIPAFSYAFAAVLLALLVRLIIWPLTQKQYLFGRQMSQLQPLIKELRARYTDKKSGQVTDVQELNKKTMGLYAEYGVNPMAGCLPMLIQIPFFLLIYQCMQNYRFEFQKGNFLWINEDLSRATSGFFAPNLGEKDNILIVLYAISMVVTSLLTPVSDPSNARQQRILGVSMSAVFSVMMFFYPLPSAFILYWVALNVFATIQMIRAYRMPMPPLVKKNAPGGGVFPTVTPTPSKSTDVSPTNGQSGSTGRPVKHKPKKKK